MRKMLWRILFLVHDRNKLPYDLHAVIVYSESGKDEQKAKSGFFVIVVVSVGLLLLALVIALILFKLKHNKHVELPTIPSDSQNPLYSAVQLPTNPSDGLLYAAVSFQNHEESLSEATVRFSKEETQCDYASVSHNTSPN
ncbi:hypothetical protein cypCar_00049980 [Cyprinus carpio]|nr:hypothetical protein cypCar_00049980 [Cyprinus carpio]